MLTITLQVDAPLGQSIGVKEAAAMCFEHLGRVTVLSVTETAPKQLTLGDERHA